MKVRNKTYLLQTICRRKHCSNTAFSLPFRWARSLKWMNLSSGTYWSTSEIWEIYKQLLSMSYQALNPYLTIKTCWRKSISLRLAYYQLSLSNTSQTINQNKYQQNLARNSYRQQQIRYQENLDIRTQFKKQRKSNLPKTSK